MAYNFKQKNGGYVLGWLSDEEAEILYDMASKSPSNLILELGSFVGKSAIPLGTAMQERKGTLICVDLFNKNQKYEGSAEEQIVPDTETAFWNNINEHNLGDSIISLKGNYNDILPTLKGKFGLIYIDGGHEIKDTIFATDWAWKHLTIGGLLIFHDYKNNKWPDVRLCVDILKQKWGVEFLKTSSNFNMVVIKK